VGKEPVAVVLPDVILDEYSADLTKENLAEMMARFEQSGRSQILVEPVPESDVSNYGVADCEGRELSAGESAPMVGMVEKPAAGTAPSNLAVVGRYVLSADIWPLLEKTEPGAWGRIQLTDAIDALKDHSSVNALALKGTAYNCGEKLGYMQAYVSYGLRHDKQGEDFKQWLAEFKQQATA